MRPEVGVIHLETKEYQRFQQTPKARQGKEKFFLTDFRESLEPLTL